MKTPDRQPSEVASTPRRRDLAGAFGSLLSIALGAVAIFHSRGFSDLGAVFPLTIGALLIGLGALYLLLVALGRSQAIAPLQGSMPRRAGVALVMLAWGFALPAFGFLLSSAGAFVLMALLAQHERWTARRLLGAALACLLVLGGLWSLFKLALQVPLP